MPLIDVASLCVLPIGAIIFFIAFYFIRGQWWWAILSALLWILFGYSSIANPPIFHYQRELGVVWIVIGIAVIWMPAYWKKKGQQKTLQEMAAEADGEEIDEEGEIEREISKQRRAKWRAMRGKKE